MSLTATVERGDASQERFLAEVIAGLSETQKRLPSKYFYDEAGLALFKAIAETPEYYLTRSEMAIMQAHAAEMASLAGPGSLLIEYGSGAADKAALLLEHLERPAAYISIDISKEHLKAAVDSLATDFPQIEILGVEADFTGDFELPRIAGTVEKRVVYFAGSTIGNFEIDEAADLLREMAGHLDSGDGLLLGFDLKKDLGVLHRAYNDEQRLTAAFNLNILVHINRELDGDFEVSSFAHRAEWNPRYDRIEMHLVSDSRQTVHLGGQAFEFDRDETIHTESSHKYDPDELSAWAAELGFHRERFWTDADRNFGVLYLSYS